MNLHGIDNVLAEFDLKDETHNSMEHLICSILDMMLTHDTDTIQLEAVVNNTMNQKIRLVYTITITSIDKV